jgi:hypothetical protein
MEKEDYLEKLDLTYLAKRLVDKEGWSPKDAKESVKRYKRFLLLALKHPNHNGTPTEDIDEVWHAHILYTKQYMADCQAIFGKYLHHAPGKEGKRETKKMQNSFAETCRLYQKEFGEPFSLTLDPSTFW